MPKAKFGLASNTFVSRLLIVRICSSDVSLDVLNRYSDINNVRHSVHIMKYIFPRQFALHNVFTSPVDKKETVQPFKDYTLREHEIALKEGRRTTKMSNQAVKARDGQQIPKRLRGELLSLIQRLQRNHTTCSYTQLLRHHCSDDVSTTCCNASLDLADPMKDDLQVLLSCKLRGLNCDSNVNWKVDHPTTPISFWPFFDCVVSGTTGS